MILTVSHAETAAVSAGVLLAQVEGWAPVLPALGPAAAAVIVVWIFVSNQKTQSGENNKRFEDLVKDSNQRYESFTGLVMSKMDTIVTKVEGIETENRKTQEELTDKFTGVVQDFKQEHRQTVDSLIGVHKESVRTMTDVSSRVGELAKQTHDQGTILNKSIDELRSSIRELSAEVARKQDREHPPTDPSRLPRKGTDGRGGTG